MLDIGYTIAISGKIKCALFKGFFSSSGTGAVCVCVGRNLLMRENNDWGCGGGRFRIDLPTTGIVLADDDGVRGGTGDSGDDEEEEAIIVVECP